jgi:hypothetical protein
MDADSALRSKRRLSRKLAKHKAKKTASVAGVLKAYGASADASAGANGGGNSPTLGTKPRPSPAKNSGKIELQQAMKMMRHRSSSIDEASEDLEDSNLSDSMYGSPSSSGGDGSGSSSSSSSSSDV